MDSVIPFPELQQRHGFWVRTGEGERQDMDVIREVYLNDGYYTRLREKMDDRSDPIIVVDIGAHIGAFVRKWLEKSIASNICCVEACPENIPVLHRNVSPLARVVHAACTYEPGDVALLNSIKVGGTATGGSTVVRKEEIDSRDTFGHLYWKDERKLPKVTLEQIMLLMGVDHIDVLKLDCEGSEFSIMEHGPMDRVGFVFGEYHGWQRFDELRRRKFADWDFGHMHATTDGLGIFHLVNPKGARI